ncbi:hypothetical protein QNH98_07245 [Myroides sp. mNGS23_01]|nr:hypothetical protein [Myroides sp. mNGS23_01]WHT40371.1 hypothetical protein QNH98_07245 [Myroides sp. mNGS23_01]
MLSDIFCDVHVIQGIDTLKGEIILKEEENNQKITVGGIPEEAILLKLDVDVKKEYKQKSFYLRRGVDFIHKGCDYVLILPVEKKVILFELKSLKPKVKRYVEQFRASECFIRYCISLNDFIDNYSSDFQFHRVLFSTKNANTLTRGMIDLTTEDKNGNSIEIKSPGFPDRIRLFKLLK